MFFTVLTYSSVLNKWGSQNKRGDLQNLDLICQNQRNALREVRKDGKRRLREEGGGGGGGGGRLLSTEE